MLYFRYLIGYKSLNAFIISTTQFFVLIQFNIIDQNLISDLALGKIIKIDTPINYSISSPLDLVSKYNRSPRNIYYLLYPYSSSVNDYITSKASTLFYSLLQNVFAQIVNIKKNVVLITQEVKDAFCNTPIILHICWLLVFQWVNVYYKEICLSFGL